MSVDGPETIVAILRSAYSSTPDPRLDEVLASMRRDWLAIARRRYSTVEDVDDAIQNALVKLLAADALAALHDPAHVRVWARSIFVRAVLDLLRERRRTQQRRVVLGKPGDDPEEILRDRLPSPRISTEESASARERLRIVQRCIGDLEIPKLKFVDGLSDEEIAARCRLSPEAVRSWLKRFRKTVRRRLTDGAKAPHAPHDVRSGRLPGRQHDAPSRGPSR